MNIFDEFNRIFYEVGVTDFEKFFIVGDKFRTSALFVKPNCKFIFNVYNFFTQINKIEFFHKRRIEILY